MMCSECRGHGMAWQWQNTVTGNVATQLPLSRQARRSACVPVTRKRRAMAAGIAVALAVAWP
eukprot:8470979-Lingulodinium_polyedra.AAC.1